MLTRLIVAVSALGLVLPAAAFAQGFAQGDKEFLLNGAGISDNGLDSTIFSINGSLGYFFTNNFEGAIRQGLRFTSIENGGSSWEGVTRAAGDYHFDYGRLWPFLGGSIGLVYGDDVSESWLFGLEAGVKYFVNNTTFIEGAIGYDWFLDDEEGNAFDDGQFVYAIGIGFKW